MAALHPIESFRSTEGSESKRWVDRRESAASGDDGRVSDASMGATASESARGSSSESLSSYGESMGSGEDFLDDSTYTSSTFSSESSEDSDAETWKEFDERQRTDLWDKQHLELRRVKRMVARLRTRHPIMNYNGFIIYTVREDFAARHIQRCFLRKIRGRAGRSFFYPGADEFEKDVQCRPLLLTNHTVRGTEIKYSVKMGGGVPRGKKLTASNQLKVPEIKERRLFQGIFEVADAATYATSGHFIRLGESAFRSANQETGDPPARKPPSEAPGSHV